MLALKYDIILVRAIFPLVCKKYDTGRKPGEGA